ncbi:nucleotidyl transferase AbiEii/AbiGii toxin family protein, partial [Patescibacteria group bacterium]|nr:nucleotidyl transferase AbiEii/AbiGii toxin family protein [Patescibacteria group bacterium]
KKITSFLEINKISYMITGAWSVIYYGRPRASHDIDFVVEINKEDIEKIISAIKQLSDDFLVPIDDIKEAIIRKDMFNVVHLPSMLKLDFWLLTDEPFDRSRFLRRQKVKILNQLMYVSSPEDTIIQKLRWYRESKIEKHLVDAAFVYQIQKENLDKRYFNSWIEKLELGEYLKELSRLNLEDYL